MLGVDLTNYPKFARVDDSVTYPKTQLDIRDQLNVISGAELPDYSGPYRADLRLTDFSNEALATRLLPWSERYLQLCVDGWAAEVAERYGPETMHEIEWAAWTEQVVPELERMRGEFLPAHVRFDDPNGDVGLQERLGTRVVYAWPFTAPPEWTALSKEQLVTWLLGSHEYLLQCIEAWATQITVRYGLDVMFDIQWTLWGNVVLPGVKRAQSRAPGYRRQHRCRLDERPPARCDGTTGQGFRRVVRDARARRGHHDLQPMRRRRPVGRDGPAGHLGEELSFDLSQVDDRDHQDVQPEHEGRHPRHPSPKGSW